MESKPDGAEVSFEGLVSLESVPPPSMEGAADVHAARTAVAHLPDAVLEELKRGTKNDSLTRRLSPFIGPQDEAADAFGDDERPTAPGRAKPETMPAAPPLEARPAPVPEARPAPVPEAPPLALSRIPTPLPLPTDDLVRPRVPTLPPPEAAPRAPAPAPASVVPEVHAVANLEPDGGVAAMMPPFRRLPRAAGMLAVLVAIAIAIAITGFLVSVLT